MQPARGVLLAGTAAIFMMLVAAPPVSAARTGKVEAADPCADSQWQPALPENTSQISPLTTVKVRQYRYTIGTAQQAPPFPPVYLAWVLREHVGNGGNGKKARKRGCADGYVVLGSSYSVPFVDITRRGTDIVADFSEKPTPSGSAHVRLNILHLDWLSGAVLHRTTLAAASPGPFEPHLGNVYDGALTLTPHELIVQGAKNGIIPGESGSGENYEATYDDFVNDPNFSPAPSWVVAH